MPNIQISEGKFNGIQACANDRGVIAAAAMDQRGSLKKAIAKAQGRDTTDNELTEFKSIVTKVLTPYATAILMDPEYGLPALETRAAGTGVLLAYEKTGYDASISGRLPDLLDDWSVRRLKHAGANAIKILLYYNPFDKNHAVTELKHAFIERIGDECRANDLPFFLEPLAYDDAYDEKSAEFAKLKPKYVTAYMEEFSKANYGVDVLKVEVPVNMKYTSGTNACSGEGVYSREDAKTLFREAASAASKPFIYLSAGVTDEVFRETIELAGEAGTNFSGVLCGRATWQDALPIYGKSGAAAAEAWLLDRGVQNIQSLNEVIHACAKPWYQTYGGLDAIARTPAPLQQA